MTPASVVHGVLHVGARLLLAGLLLWAGLEKVSDRQASILAVDAYDVLPEGVVEPVAILLPWTEVALGLLLLAGLFTRVSAGATAVLLVAFIAAMGQARARGLPIDCGCFGGGGRGDGVSWWDILRDVPLLAAAAFLVWRPRGPIQADAYFEPEGGDVERHEDDEARAPARQG
jgi:uncharacterized membrane protein YphA (DoxX/SURF4 family)